MISKPTNILLIQLGDIGDVVLTTPAIRAVKESYPDAHVSVMVRKPFGSLLMADPSLHEVVEFEIVRGNKLHRLRNSVSFTRRLRRACYDLVIDLRTGDRGAILSFLTGAPIRIGSPDGKKKFWRDLLFTKIVHNQKIAHPPVHPGADQSLRVLREIGINTVDSTPKLYIATADQLNAKAILVASGIALETGFVTVNPFSRWKYKEWNNEKWGKVIDKIWEACKLPAVLIGSPQEAVACRQIVAEREDHTINLAGKTTLGELAAIIAISRLHLGVDSAAPHIGAAVNIPTLTIHGPTDWRAWRIVNDQHKVVCPGMDCVPCNNTGCDGKGRSRCLDELNVEPVVHTALELLEQGKKE